MHDTIWIPDLYQSQYGLLGAMAHELRDAIAESGRDARLYRPGADDPPESGVYLFMNFPPDLDDLPPALLRARDPMRAVHFFVDHPLALVADRIDEWSRRAGLENYTLCLPCLDDAHLLRARFPGLRHRWVPHGVPRSALRDPAGLTRAGWDRREYDAVVTGSVRPMASIKDELAALRPSHRNLVQEMVHLMVAEPHLGYVDAFDLVMGSRGVITGDWDAQRSLWNLVVSQVNRARRITLVRSLQGLRVGVFGSSEWEPECTGTIEYAGEVSYDACADAFARGRVAVAWGPTQFVHAYSERIMQAMAAGACVVADDRLLVRRDFNLPEPTATLFDWSDPGAARRAVDAALADPDASLARARRGRDHVERRCLWSHRVDAILSDEHRLVSGAARTAAA